MLLPRFEAGPALALMDKEDVTFFAGVPTMYWGLLGALDDSGVDVKKLAATLRVAAAGGSALPVEVLGAAKGRQYTAEELARAFAPGLVRTGLLRHHPDGLAPQDLLPQ